MLVVMRLLMCFRAAQLTLFSVFSFIILMVRCGGREARWLVFFLSFLCFHNFVIVLFIYFRLSLFNLFFPVFCFLSVLCLLSQFSLGFLSVFSLFCLFSLFSSFSVFSVFIIFLFLFSLFISYLSFIYFLSVFLTFFSCWPWRKGVALTSVVLCSSHSFPSWAVREKGRRVLPMFSPCFPLVLFLSGLEGRELC